MALKLGDRVKILDVSKIEGAKDNGYRNGDSTYLITSPLGCIAIPSKTVEYPLSIAKSELNYLALDKDYYLTKY